MWSFELSESVRELWRKAVMPYDSVTVAGAILKLHEGKGGRPRLNQFKQAIEDMAAAKEAAMSPHPVAKTAVGDSLEWTHVWSWLRFTQGDTRAMPQQDYLGIVGGTSLEEMSMKEYEEVRQQWVAAGAPKVSLAKLLSGIHLAG